MGVTVEVSFNKTVEMQVLIASVFGQVDMTFGMTPEEADHVAGELMDAARWIREARVKAATGEDLP